jgi:hypothetical protein
VNVCQSLLIVMLFICPVLCPRLPIWSILHLSLLALLLILHLSLFRFLLFFCYSSLRVFIAALISVCNVFFFHSILRVFVDALYMHIKLMLIFFSSVITDEFLFVPTKLNEFGLHKFYTIVWSLSGYYLW